MSSESFNTLSVHAGEDLDEHHGALSVPIYPASVFAFPDADEGASIHNELKPGYYYGRLGNPTTAALEKAMSQLENAEDAVAFSSGMSAVAAAVLAVCRSGDHLVAPASMYSTAANLFRYIKDRFRIESTLVDATDPENYRSAAKENTKLFWLETPSNPMMQITHLRGVSAIAEELGVTTVADNTFATPYNQRPLEHGVDAVIHSATKYLGGHSDLTAGVLAGNSKIIETARLEAGKLFGGNIAPQVAWLVLRGIKTLALRMERHNQNAFALADMFERHSKAVATYYPGLATHRNHEIARDQMRGFGGMVGLDVGTPEAAKKLINALQVCKIATSLGGVETIIQHSASMTHATLSPQERAVAGISEGLLRLSVGIEDIGDLERDFQQALAKI